MSQTGQDRQGSSNIGRTVLQTVVQKLASQSDQSRIVITH